MFDIDFGEKSRLLLHIRKFLLYPAYWLDPSNQINHQLTWFSVKFNVGNYSTIPEESGLYCFIVCPEVMNFISCSYLFYVGKTNRTLKIRYRDYLNEQAGKGKPRTKVYEMLNLYKDHVYFAYAKINDSQQVDKYEESLLNMFVPFVNTAIPVARIKNELKNIYEN